MSNNANTSKLRLWLLLLMAFLMPFKIKGAALLPAVYLLFWLFTGGYKGAKVLNSRHPALWLLILFYVYHIFGLLWTENINDGLFDLQVKFSLLFFPALFMLSPGFERPDLQRIIRWFISGNAIALSICLVRAALSDDPYGFFYVSFSWFMHPGYFSMYLCYSIAIILYDVIYNSSDNLFSKKLSIFLIALFIAGVLLLSSKTGLFLVLCILSWYVYLQFVSGSGIRAAVMISGLIAGIVVLTETTPYIHDRLHEIKLAFNETPDGSEPHSTIMRFQVWRSALAIISEDPVLGTGTGDVKDELIKYYRQHGYDRVADNELNSHNQFLQSFAALGIVGFLLLSGFFIAGYRDAKRNGNVMLKWLLLILFVFGLFESVIEVQAGVMFAGLFIPLLFQWKPDAKQAVNLNPLKSSPLLDNIRRYATDHPLRFALGLGFAIRLVAVIFSRGFGMHDDHFLVIEASSAWADGTDYDSWLPAHGGVRPDGHSFFYSGLHFIFFHLLKFLGIEDPQTKMFFVRLIHALLSLGTIYFGYKITRKISDRKSASVVALLLAVLWFMPWLSVRNLVEVACIPFLVWGTWMMIRSDNKETSARNFLLAGMLFGIAFSIRFQTVLFIGGAGLALLFQRRLKDAIFLGAGTIIVFTATQAPVDYIIWGSPFAQFGEYIRYNLDNAYNYIVGPWYNYTLLILGILIPPVSLFLFFGFMRNWKKHLLIFLPVLVFLAFHSYFPNKQERFILPIVPFFVILGIPGWREWLSNRQISGAWKKALTVSWVFFWTINILLLPFITTMYSKRARVESMTYLYPKRQSISSLIMEDTNRSSAKMAPEFYLGKWIFTYDLSQASGYDSLEFYMNKLGPEYYPQYALFLGDKNLEQRVQNLRNYFPEMSLETTIDPGFVDKVLYWLNPRNANDVIFIYRTGVPPAKEPEDHVNLLSSSEP